MGGVGLAVSMLMQQVMCCVSAVGLGGGGAWGLGLCVGAPATHPSSPPSSPP